MFLSENLMIRKMLSENPNKGKSNAAFKGKHKMNIKN